MKRRQRPNHEEAEEHDKKHRRIVNRCPHFSLPLDFEPGEFSTYDGRILMCAHHSAMFRFEDGVCVEGPCAGHRLDPVEVRISDDTVQLSS